MDIAEKVQGLWSDYKSNVIDKHKDLWLECYQKYCNYLDPAKANARESNTFIPRSFDSVETAVPRLLLAMFSVKPPFQAAPRGGKDIAQAEALTDVLTYYNDRLNFFDYVGRVLKMAAIYGISIAKSGWDNKNMMPIRYVVHPQDFFIDPTAQCIEESEYCGDRKIRTLSYLKKMEGIGLYKNIAQVKEKKQTYSPSSELLSSIKDIHGVRNPYEEWNDTENPQYEVIEAYLEGGKRIVTIAGGVVIRDEENPFPSQAYPYAPVILTPDISEFYGIGLIEPIRFLQDDINDLHNAQSDYIGRSVNSIMLAGPSEWDTAKSWKWQMGGMWKVNQIDGVRPLDMKPLAPESWAMGDRLNMYVDRTLALSDMARGISTGQTGNSGATGAALLAQAADTRLKLQLYTIQNCFKRLIAFDVKNIQAFVPAEFVVRITEKPYYKPMKRDDIQGEFDIFAAGISDLTTKDMKRSQLMNLLQILITTGVPQMLITEGKRINVYEIVKQVLETFEFKSMDTIISDIPSGMGGMPMGGQPAMGGAGQDPLIETPAVPSDMLKSVAEKTAPLQTEPIGGLR